MITIFNRKEVLTTFSMGEYANAKSILSECHIPYATKTSNMSGGNLGMGGHRSTWGSIGENLNFAYQYYLYVHKKDYEEATYRLAEKMRH